MSPAAGFGTGYAIIFGHGVIIGSRWDAVADAAVLGDAITGAIRDGGQLASFRAYDGDPGRGIRSHVLNVRDRATDHAAIARLRELVEEGVLSVRVGRAFPAAQAVEAHRQMDAGGTRGRIVLEFPVEVAEK